MVIYKEFFKCPYCKKLYPDWDTAHECAVECVSVDEVLQVNSACCEMCGKDYNDEILAEVCEQEHTDNSDSFYEQYLVKKNFEKLEKASKMIGQKKLGDVL